ncbi:MAG: monofunctional biosynthetic peptidoglycan transglycosylase [Bacteroidaceae bacterium]|nr:monofunctional biosynthetic peptidoglycan transglycosylase [Bacteroidaceae bacterium]
MIPRIFKWLLRLVAAFVILSLSWVLVYRFVPVPATPLMYIRKISEGININHEWTPIESIAPDMQLAVIAAEDSYFMQHRGFDWNQIEKAQDDAKKGKKLRGASTISQQTAKNVFLWNGRSWIRKGLEAYFTMLIELFWSKERIMEVYLNSIEMGEGLYGIAAVAKANFNKVPAKLTRKECALIAATLPNPRKFSSKKPSKYTRKRQASIIKNMIYIERTKLHKETEE